MSGRAAPDPPLAEVVQRRLAALLEDIPARRAIGEPAAGRGRAGASSSTVGPASGSAVDARSEPRLSDSVLLDPVLPDPVPPDTVPPDPGSPPAAAASGSSPASGSPGSVATRAASRLGEPARRAFEFARAHLVAVGVVLLTGCLWAGYQVVQARSTPVAAATPVSVAPTPQASPAPTPSPTRAVVLVHVLGEIARPGVVQLPEGARVADAIEAAGGLTGRADPGELNLAAVVADGSQVVIGSRAEPRGEVRTGSEPATGGGTSPAQDARKVSLNTATEAELDTLPGIGPVTAGRIVAWRAEHGRFTRIEELQEVDGIGPRTFADLAPHVSL